MASGQQKAYAIIPAGGRGTRMGAACPKQFLKLGGLPLLIHTLRAVARARTISGIIVVVPADHLAFTEDMLKEYPVARVEKVVAGGRLRQDSVAAGLALVPEECDVVAVHDGARPLVSPQLIDACVGRARQTGAAMAAVAVHDTIKEVDEEGVIRRTVDRTRLWRAQTPQVVRLSLLRQAFAQAAAQGFVGTDEASFLEMTGHDMAIVEGSEQNIKVTQPADVALAESLLGGGGDKGVLRVGHGYDAHTLVAGRPLILGGVTIPYERGLLGHSDADVLTHALCDAILGALGLGDIGRHFPDSDPRLQGVSSLLLLEKVMDKAESLGYGLGNGDITVLAQAPKLAPYWPQMIANLARVCQVESSHINLKGTTTEKMGFVGRQEGIAAHAVVTMVRL